MVSYVCTFVPSTHEAQCRAYVKNKSSIDKGQYYGTKCAV